MWLINFTFFGFHYSRKMVSEEKEQKDQQWSLNRASDRIFFEGLYHALNTLFFLIFCASFVLL